MLTIHQASQIPVNSFAFEQAIEEVTHTCECERCNSEARKVLSYLLQRNEDYVMAQAYGGKK